MLIAENLSQKYAQKTIVEDFSHSFQPGKIHGIIGPNGAGKSTLLRLLTAMETPVAGRVFFKGRHLLAPSRHIGCVWQRPYLFRCTVEENILYGLKIRNWNRKRIAERIEYLTELFRLNELRKRWALDLSGGETARIAIAQAIAFRPEMLILDEPAANLDPSNTRAIEEMLLTLQQQECLTIILVTHDMFQAKRLADNTLYVSQGRLIESGPTHGIFASPESPETTRFIAGEL